MKLHAGDSRRSLSALTKSIKNLTLTDRGGATASPGQAVLLARGAPTSFPRFFDLPPEIRLLVYEQYFADSGLAGGTLIAPKSHPRTKHATALLLVSKTVFEEALPVMYQQGTMTINLSPRYSINIKDGAYWLDHIMPLGCNFKGRTGQLLRMQKVHLTLGPRENSFQASRKGNASNWWQYVFPIFSTTVQMFNDFTLAIHVGDIISNPPTPGAGILYRKPTFATMVCRPSFQTHGWRDIMRTCDELERTVAETKAEGNGKRFLRRSRASREVVCLYAAVFQAAVAGEWLGRELSVENHDRSRKEVITSDRMPDMVDSARRVVGEGKEKGVWLVLGDKKMDEMVQGSDSE